MAETEAISRYSGLLSSIGKAGLNMLFPNDFEYYMVALELVDSRGMTIDYFSFPVSPSSISQTEPEITNVKQTAGGVVSVSSSVFVPKEITIQGTFGRKFKVILNRSGKTLDFSAIRYSADAGVYKKSNYLVVLSEIKTMAFDPSIKTGFGCLKILQSICDKSNSVGIDNKPFKLYFYNLALSESWLVKKMVLTVDANERDRNMLWNYNLQFKAIAPLDNLISNFRRSLATALTVDNLQNGVNQLGGDIKRRFL